MNKRQGSLDLGDNNQTPLMIGESMSDNDKSPLRNKSKGKTEMDDSRTPARSQKSKRSVKNLDIDKIKASQEQIDEDEDEEYSDNQDNKGIKTPPPPKVEAKTAPPADDDGITVPPEDDIPNNTDKCIDFQTQLEALKKRTTSTLPYTLTQTEDAMFMDKDTVVTLEFHYYQNDCKYSSLKPINEHIDHNGNLVDINGEKCNHKLGTHNFNLDPNKVHPMSAFDRTGITNYVDEGKDIVKDQRAKPDAEFFRIDLEQARIMTMLKEKIAMMMASYIKKKKRAVNRKDDAQMIEGIIAQYKITSNGTMQRVIQDTVTLGRRKFFPSKDGNMVLTRSKDKKIISLTNFDEFDDNNEYFKIQAWTIKLKKINPQDNFQQLQQAMNNYYEKVKSSFDYLIEIAFVGGCLHAETGHRYIQFVYMETKQRGLQEQQEYELLMKDIKENMEAENPHEAMGGDTERFKTGFENRDKPRKARKFVFFRDDGKIVFEYGGIQSPFAAQNSDGNKIPIFELGCLVKEIREEEFAPQICFFFAGDFMKKEIKQHQQVFKWGLNFVLIDMKKVFEMANQEEKMDMIRTHIKVVVNQPEEEGYLNYFPFDHRWIQSQWFNWEANINIATNRKFDQIALLNQPIDKDEFGDTQIYVHGTKFKSMIDDQRIRKKGFFIDVPLCKQLAGDAVYRHTRNHNIKDQLYIDEFKNNTLKTICLRMDHPNQKLKVFSPNFSLTKHVSQHDTWLHYKKDIELGTLDEIFAAIHVTPDNQDCILQTEVPERLQRNMNDAQMVIRKTSSFYQQQADLPAIAYNLGDSKICLQNTLQTVDKKIYLLPLNPDERFVCFLDFNQFEDIGFYPANLRIECCAHLCFMTAGNGKAKGDVNYNRINLILYDPFFTDTVLAHFKSTTHFDNEIFQVGDTIIRSKLQSTMGKKRDMYFKSYVWTQTPTGLIRSKMIGTGANTSGEPEQDSDVPDEGDDDGEDDAGISGVETFEPVTMIMNERDFIYYVTKLNGICQLKEANPRDPYIQNHETIMEIKCEKCLGLQTDANDKFYFMDENFVVYMLERGENNRQLSLFNEYTMKEMQTLDYKPTDYDNILLTSQYAAQGNKLFYLFNNSEEPFPEGIMESEDIVPEKRGKPKSKYIKGPLVIGGSKRFFNIYQVKKFVSHITICQRPDATSKTMINDFQNTVDMSSFLENGKILIKILNRFMVFTSNGGFIDEILFDDSKIPSQNDQDDDMKTERSQEGFYTNRHLVNPVSNVEKLKKRRTGDPILDFMGKPYVFKAQKPQPICDDSNKREILNMSYDNKWYLFYNRMTERFYIYELQEQQVAQPVDFNETQAIKPPKIMFKFVLTYELDNDCFMFKHMRSIDIDPIAFYRANISQIKCGEGGVVRLCYVENLPKSNVKEIDSKDSDNEISNVQCRLMGVEFTPEVGQYIVKGKCFTQIIEFPRDAQDCLAQILEEKKMILDRKLRLIRSIQERKPRKLFDYSEYENIIDDLVELEGKRSDMIFAKIYYQNLIVIYCGKYVRYGEFFPNKKKQPGASMDIMDYVIKPHSKTVLLQDIALHFGDSVEVTKLIEVEKVPKHVLQLVAIDHSTNVYSILTWDFVLNVEKNLMQCNPDLNDQVGYHVVKGMNKKMNYLINQHTVIDLEYNIPLRQTYVNQQLDTAQISYRRQLDNINDMFNQRKIFQDGAKFLGCERPSVLFYPLSRMDLILWLGIHTLGDDADLIQNSCSLDSINCVIEGSSLLHYFADNSELIQKICEMYKKAESEGQLKGSNKYLPLQALNPDPEGKTALYRAVQKQAPQSFEIFVGMLTNFNDQCVSKMMLKSLALMLCHESEIVINFFHEAKFQPPQMQEEQFIPWEDEMEDFVFPSHTSVMSRELLIQELEKQGIKESKPKKVKGPDKKNTPVVQEDDSITKRKKIVKSKKNFRPTILEEKFDTGMPEGMKPPKRVTVEALDMDWIFIGDNCKVLLRLLATEANNLVLVKNSIKTVVDLLWKYYQPVIIRKIFYPYLIYLFTVSNLCGRLVGPFLLAKRRIGYYDNKSDLTEDEMNEITDMPGYEKTFEDDTYEANQQIYSYLKPQVYGFSIIGVVLLSGFLCLEIEGIIDDSASYFSDSWNCIDFTSLTINAFFLVLSVYSYVDGFNAFEVTTILSIGAFACFFMQLKMFYWMRLFPMLAYYVKLIQQTLYDAMPFMVMVLIIVMAFSTFLYVANNGLLLYQDQGYFNGSKQLDEDTKTYFDSYFDNGVTDVMVSVYMLGALGAFNSSLYVEGPGRYRVTVMFIVATFFIQVVFMNMLIAIMGDTFAQVLEKSVESGIREQVALIADFDWLLDLSKIFEGKKYIIRVYPSSSDGGAGDPVQDKIAALKDNMGKKLARVQNTVHKRIDSNDANLIFLIGLQQSALEGILRKLKQFEVNFDQLVRVEGEEEEVPINKVEEEALNKKKKELLGHFNVMNNEGKVSEEAVEKIATEWVELADRDGNGELDFKEFYDFFTKIEGLHMTDEELKQMHEEFDGSGNGMLSIEEFARAIYQELLADNEVEDVEDE